MKLGLRWKKCFLPIIFHDSPTNWFPNNFCPISKYSVRYIQRSLSPTSSLILLIFVDIFQNPIVICRYSAEIELKHSISIMLYTLLEYHFSNRRFSYFFLVSSLMPEKYPHIKNYSHDSSGKKIKVWLTFDITSFIAWFYAFATETKFLII